MGKRSAQCLEAVVVVVVVVDAVVEAVEVVVVVVVVVVVFRALYIHTFNNLRKPLEAKIAQALYNHGQALT